MNTLPSPMTVARPSALSPRPSRSAFTLVELLVVIAIIGVLAALISVAAMNAVYAAKQTQIKVEVDQLDMAMKAFKQKYGSYPPCDLRLPTTANISITDPANANYYNAPLRTFVARAFPRFVQSNSSKPNRLKEHLDAAGADTTNFNPARALTFWLSGFNPDVTSPFAVAETTPTGSPTPYTGSRTPFMEFNKTRLLVADVAAPTVALSTTLTGNLKYVPPGGRNVPYVYFDSRSYRATQAFVPHFPLLTADIALTGLAVPYAHDVNSNRVLNPTTGDSFSDSPPGNGTYDQGETITDGNSDGVLTLTESDTWANPDTFQIISAGQDGLYGATATTVPRVRLFPAGSGYDTEDNDNVTNFSDRSSLEDARP